jgi:hypothetical protein
MRGVLYGFRFWLNFYDTLLFDGWLWLHLALG